MTSRRLVRAQGHAQEARFSWAWLAFDLLYLAAMFTTATLRHGHAQFPDPRLAAYIVVSWLPLLLRRRHPTAVVAVVAVVESLHLVFGVSIHGLPNPGEVMGAFQPVPLASIAATFTLAARRPGRHGWAPGVAAAILLLLVGLSAQGSDLVATSFVVFDLVIMSTGAGVLVSLRRERILRDERDRQAEIRMEVVAERVRIAQDLHDVLAHHLTLVNAQAGVAEYLLRHDPQQAAGALQDIAGNTRRALDELRTTVGLLRADSADSTDSADSADSAGTSGTSDGEALRPAPGLGQLDELVAGFRVAGAVIEVTTSGAPEPLSAGADLAAYRILQEALTNAVKHAPGARVEITVTWQHQHLDLRVHNGPAPGRPAGHQGPGTRHGLIGMRERATTAGGTLTFGPAPATGTVPAGGFDVHATIPVRPNTDRSDT